MTEIDITQIGKPIRKSGIQMKFPGCNVKASGKGIVTNTIGVNGGVISEAGEVEETTNAKEGNNNSIAGGTQESLATSTEKLSYQNKAPTEDTIKEKKGVFTPVNVNSSINLFLDSDDFNDEKSAKTGINITKVRKQQNNKLGIETKYSCWNNESLKKKARNMSVEDVTLKSASSKDNDNAVLSKKIVRGNKAGKHGRPLNKRETTANSKKIRGAYRKVRVKYPWTTEGIGIVQTKSIREKG